jgi:uncharacterized protein YqjF (DUF2071 family)
VAERACGTFREFRAVEHRRQVAAGRSTASSSGVNEASLAHSSLTRVDHRPWPLPGGEWTWRQSWCDLLFAYWPIRADLLQPLVPAPLRVQEFEGRSWVGVVPFRMKGVMGRPLPDLPYLSAFPELKLRLYVEHDGKPGVWSLSLDAANVVAVWAARRFFHLPYFHARIGVSGLPESADFHSLRLSRPTGIEFTAQYEPASDPYESQAGSLEHWLTERYCLYAQSRKGQIYCAEVHHHPWQLQRAEAEIARNDLFAPDKLPLSGPPELVHFSRQIDVVVWPPVAVAA